MKRYIIAVAIWVMCLFFAMDAGAKTNRELTYRYNQIWGTVIRFLRVDNGFKIVEKDKIDGYIMFEYKDGERTFNSSIELIKVEIEGRYYVRAGMHIQKMPSYVEILLQDKLKRKLRDEYGDPPPAKMVEPETKPGDDKEKDESDGDELTEESIDKNDYAASEEAKED